MGPITLPGASDRKEPHDRQAAEALDDARRVGETIEVEWTHCYFESRVDTYTYNGNSVYIRNGNLYKKIEIPGTVAMVPVKMAAGEDLRHPKLQGIAKWKGIGY